MKAVPGLFLASLLAAQSPAQSPARIAYACPSADIDSFGLACSADEPCSVFLELAAADAVGATVFLAGNLHTQSATLRSILLASDDGGKTWTEPFQRIRAAALDQIQFSGFANGWVSGQIIEPLPRDPFLLVSTDGGKTWRERPVFEESRFGSLADFWFESPASGELVIEHSERGAVKHEVYQTKTGGDSWEVKEITGQPVNLKGRPKEESSWRIRTDAASKTYRLERRSAAGWDLIASFLIHVADCK